MSLFNIVHELSDKGGKLCFDNLLGEPCEGGVDEVKRILEAIHSTTRREDMVAW